jgi:TetR/AcrR family transcriptional repressor of nem operon
MADLAHRHGYKAVGVDQVCEAAQVKKGSFYHFFASKRDLMFSALERQWQHASDHIDTAFADDLRPCDRIRRLFSMAASAETKNKMRAGHVLGCPFGGVASEAAISEPMLAKRADKAIRSLTSAVRTCLMEAVRSGELPPETSIDDASESVAAYFQGVALLARMRNDPTVFSRLGRRAVLLVGASEQDARKPRAQSTS